MVKVEVYDQDLTSRDHIGNFEVSLARIIGSHEQTLTGDLTLPGKPNSRGKIILNLDKVSYNNDMVYFDLQIENLKSQKFCIFGTDDPFFFIERSLKPDSNKLIRVHEQEKKVSTCNPLWTRLRFPAKKLCNGDIHNRIKFICYCYKANGYHKEYGEFSTTLDQLIQGETEYKLTAIGNESVSIGSTATFKNLLIENRPSFYDFLHSGWEINLTVGIDFTASNGPAQYMDSLHY